MFYQVRANLYFADPDEAIDFYRDCKLALAKSEVINPALENEEYSLIELIENNHDQDPNQFCVELQSANNKPEH